MSKFDVLGTERAIRDDDDLTGTDAWILVCAVLRTDNETCKVRYNLEGLAKDAKASHKTVLRAFQKPQVLKYFKTVERSSRRVDLWFHESMTDIQSVNAIDGHTVQEANDGHCVHDDGHTVPVDGHTVHNDGLSVHPSTLSSLPSTPESDTDLEEQESKAVEVVEKAGTEDKSNSVPSTIPNTVVEESEEFLKMETTLNDGDDEMTSRLRTDKPSFKVLFEEGSQAFNFFELTYKKKYGTNTFELWTDVKMKYKDVLESLTLDALKELIVKYLETESGGHSRFLQHPSSLLRTIEFQEADIERRKNLRAESDGRVKTWEDTKARLLAAKQARATEAAAIEGPDPDDDSWVVRSDQR